MCAPHQTAVHPPLSATGPHRSPRTVCPACAPRQFAYAFNQPLSWDTSRVTSMAWVFTSCAPPPPACPVPPTICTQSRPLPCARSACIAGSAHVPPASRGSQLVPHRVPCLRPSPGREGLQPTAELGHLPRLGHEQHVRCALLPAPCPPQSAVAPSTRPPSCMHRIHTRGRGGSCAPYIIPRTRPPPHTRQGENSLSDANKLLIRCAWAGPSEFWYGSSWGPGNCS